MKTEFTYFLVIVGWIEEILGLTHKKTKKELITQGSS